MSEAEYTMADLARAYAETMIPDLEVVEFADPKRKRTSRTTTTTEARAVIAQLPEFFTSVEFRTALAKATDRVGAVSVIKKVLQDFIVEGLISVAKAGNGPYPPLYRRLKGGPT